MLKPHQIEATDGVREALKNHPSTLVVMPTGTGKTVVFGHVAREYHDAGKRTLVIAHREELVEQARKTMERYGLHVGVEMAEQRAMGDMGLFSREDVVVASVPTLTRRLKRWQSDSFGLLVIDEAHHACAASYRTILDFFSGAKHLGVTATPDRGDKLALGKVFESVAYRLEIGPAIAQGLLVPVAVRIAKLKSVDLDRVKVVAGDLSADGVAKEMSAAETVAGVVEVLLREALPRGRGMVFTATVEQAKLVADALNAARPDTARALDGTCDRDDVRRPTLAAWRAGEFQFLVNCALFTEGFDEWSVKTIALLRPTKSRALYAQMIGRGTRLCPDCFKVCEHKDELLVIDFTGRSRRHKLVGPDDVLGGSWREVGVGGRRKMKAAETKEGQRRAARLADREERKRAAQVLYEMRAVDPYGGDGERAGEATHVEPPITAQQAVLLEKFKVPPHVLARLTKREAGSLIGRIMLRKKTGLSSYAQSVYLLKHMGWSRERVQRTTYAEAEAAITKHREGP